MKSELSDAAQRVNWVLKKVWNGSQTKMASEIGVSQSAISNVVTGRQQPGRKLLAAVASNSLINSTWLVTGEGDPLITLGTEAGRRALYVAHSLFEGYPEDNGDHLGSMLEVPIRWYRPSRYWYQVSSVCPLIRAELLKLAADDMVLFEPDPRAWPESLVGYPCVRKNSENALILDYVAHQDGRLLWTGIEESTPTMKSPEGRNFRSIDIDGDSDNFEQFTARSLMAESLVAVGLFRMGGFGKS